MTALRRNAAPGEPFYKRTEFYLALAALVFGGLLGSGLLGDGTVWSRMIGMVVEALAVVGYTAARTIAKSGMGSGRPGYKTSEFWQTLTASGLLLFQMTDVVPADHSATELIAALLAALPSVSYGISRGKVKANGPGLYVLALLLLLPTVGCNASLAAKTGAREGFAALKATSQLGEQLFRDLCDVEATKCRDVRRALEATTCPASDLTQQAKCERDQQAGIDAALSCEPLRQCHVRRKQFDELVRDGHGLVRVVKAASEQNIAALAAELWRLIERARNTVALAQGGAK